MFLLEGPDEIPHKVHFLKDEGNKFFKNKEFTNGSAYYLSGIELLCFSCIVSYANEVLFKHLTISLSLNLAPSKLKQGKFTSTMTFCSLVLEFEHNKMKTLFRRAEAAFVCTISTKLYST